jgi:CelD/BcsL family acetyltransferase involved in cellulose biosynthesis
VFIGTGISDCLDFLVRPDSALQHAAALCESISCGLGPFDICDLQEVSSESPLLRAEFPAAVGIRKEAHNRRFVVRLPESMELYLRGLAKKHRSNLRRARRLLAESGPAEIEAADAESLDSFLDALFSLHCRRWAELQQPGVLQGDAIRSFHGEVCARMLKRDLLRFYRMSRLGRPAAALYSFRRGDRVYCYLSGFDPEMGRCSPGIVLLAHAIEKAIGEGVREFDFLRGDEEYKMKWNPEPRQNYRVRLIPEKART